VIVSLPPVSNSSVPLPLSLRRKTGRRNHRRVLARACIPIYLAGRVRSSRKRRVTQRSGLLLCGLAVWKTGAPGSVPWHECGSRLAPGGSHLAPGGGDRQHDWPRLSLRRMASRSLAERVLVPKPRQLHRLIASHRIYVDWPQELLMPMGICCLLSVDARERREKSSSSGEW
jgi:hypothetical protein